MGVLGWAVLEVPRKDICHVLCLQVGFTFMSKVWCVNGALGSMCVSGVHTHGFGGTGCGSASPSTYIVCLPVGAHH